MGTETELMHVQAARASVQVAVDVPGSKSMTCRALVLAAISAQPVVLRGALRSDDTNALAHAISALGMSMQWSGDTIKVDQGEGLQVDGARVDLGHGGTPARFMLGLACLGGRAIGTVVDGSEQLRSRPMGDMVGMLRELGVSVDERGEPGHLPLCVRGSSLAPSSLERSMRALCPSESQANCRTRRSRVIMTWNTAATLWKSTLTPSSPDNASCSSMT